MLVSRLADLRLHSMRRFRVIVPHEFHHEKVGNWAEQRQSHQQNLSCRDIQ